MISIILEPDMSIEPGHQWILLPADNEGNGIAKALLGVDALYPYMELSDVFVRNGFAYRIPHNAEVDARIVELINALAHVRFSAPGLVQMTMSEAMQETPG